MRGFVLVAAFWSAVPASAAQSQSQVDALAPGARVRLEAPGVLAGSAEGTVVERSADTLVFASESRVMARLPLRAISRLEVSRGESRARGMLRGAAVGAAIGLPAGLALASFGDDPNASRGEIVVGSTVTYGAIGALVGLLTGVEVWSPLALPQGAPPPSTTSVLGESPELAAGTRVRVRRADGRRTTGTVVARDREGLLLAVQRGTTRLTADAVQQVDVSRGKSRQRGARRGALWGAATGLVTGLGALAQPDTARGSVSGDDTAAGLYLFAFAGAVWGAGIGAFVGSEQWVPLVRQPGASGRGAALHPLVRPGSDRVQLGLSARW